MAWFSVLSGSWWRSALAGTLMATLAVAAAALVLLVVPVLIVKSRLSNAR